jgi:membrane protease YdiL (CAAX protease family)
MKTARRRIAAAAAAAAVLWTSPGLGCFEALAQVKPMAAPLPEALALPLAAVETQSFGPGPFDALCGAISTQLGDLANIPTEDRRQVYLRLAAASNRSDWSLSAELLQAVAANPGSRNAVVARLRSIAARMGARTQELDSIERRWAAGDGATEHVVAPVDPTKLKLVSRSGNGKWNAFHAEYDGASAFVKIDSLDDEIDAHSEVSRISLAPNVAVPKPIAVGLRGLPELPDIANGRHIPSTDAGYYAAKGGRVFVMESHAAPTAEDLTRGRSRLADPVAIEDAAGLAAAIEIVHDWGRVHGDLRPANILVRQPGAGTHFSLIDWEHSKTATAPGRHEERGFIRNLIAKLLKHGGEPDSIVPLAPPELEKEPEQPPVRHAGRGIALAGIIAALAFVPPLFKAPPAHWQLFLPGGVLNLAPFGVPFNLALLLGLGVALGLLKNRLDPWIHSLNSWMRASAEASGQPAVSNGVRRISRMHPANPLVVSFVAFSAFMEEIGCRLALFQLIAGWIAPYIAPGLLYPAAALGVAAVFTRLHHYGPVWTRFAGSLMFSAACLLTGSIWLSTIMHFTSNWAWLWRHHLVQSRRDSKPSS